MTTITGIILSESPREVGRAQIGDCMDSTRIVPFEIDNHFIITLRSIDAYGALPFRLTYLTLLNTRYTFRCQK